MICEISHQSVKTIYRAFQKKFWMHFKKCSRKTEASQVVLHLITFYSSKDGASRVEIIQTELVKQIFPVQKNLCHIYKKVSFYH